MHFAAFPAAQRHADGLAVRPDVGGRPVRLALDVQACSRQRGVRGRGEHDVGAWGKGVADGDGDAGGGVCEGEELGVEGVYGGEV